MKVTEHVSYQEATQTNTGIENIPSGEQMERIKLLCTEVFEPLREWAEVPIKINSVFRSLNVNNKVGGSSSSQHMANNGAAMDIDDNYGGKTNADMFYHIKNNLEFDQLIWEFGTDRNPSWIHVSYKKGKNRGQVLRAEKINGRIKYNAF